MDLRSFFFELVKRFLIDIADVDASAVLGKSLGDGVADAGAARGNEDPQALGRNIHSQILEVQSWSSFRFSREDSVPSTLLSDRSRIRGSAGASPGETPPRGRYAAQQQAWTAPTARACGTPSPARTGCILLPGACPRRAPAPGGRSTPAP